VETRTLWNYDLCGQVETPTLWNYDLCGQVETPTLWNYDLCGQVKTSTLWNYDLCGQRTDPVGLGETVYLRCADKLQAHRYLVLQIPRVDCLNFCELQVYVRRT